MMPHIRKIGWLFGGAGLAALLAAGGCGDVPVVGGEIPCDSTPFAPNEDCAKQSVPDAGTDAEPDAAMDGSSLKDDPGLEPSTFSSCKGACVPEASDSYAIDWPYEPLVVWFGSKSELDKKTCPANTPFEKLRGFDKLVAPPAQCEACACSAEGSCAGLPETIQIRNGKCGVSNVQITPFDGPANWDGSCTAVNAMAAGKLCNGVLCAQSVSTSALPAPTNESCAPAIEKPTAMVPKHEWLEGALACHAQDLEGTCPGKEHCVEPLSEGWHHCLARKGKHDVCPYPYNAHEPRWVYQDNPIDDRGCSECVCGAPKGGICVASLRLYSDSVCSSQLNDNLIASTDPFCVDLVPPGLALGAKTIGNLSYVPGTCSVTGGEPIGAAIPNDDENSGVVTICCRAPEPAPTPPG